MQIKCWGVNKVNYGLGENGEYPKLPLLSPWLIYIFLVLGRPINEGAYIRGGLKLE